MQLTIRNGVIEVGANKNGDVIIICPYFRPDEHGVVHLFLSPDSARQLARLMNSEAVKAENEVKNMRKVDPLPIEPVDRTKTAFSGGAKPPGDHTEINPATGQQAAYVVLTDEERAKGFQRPVRREYTHMPCGGHTTMSKDIAETYARDPGFYSGTFCVKCQGHFPLNQFVWKYTKEEVGS